MAKKTMSELVKQAGFKSVKQYAVVQGCTTQAIRNRFIADPEKFKEVLLAAAQIRLTNTIKGDDNV